jgi:hypothetical protein
LLTQIPLRFSSMIVIVMTMIAPHSDLLLLPSREWLRQESKEHRPHQANIIYPSICIFNCDRFITPYVRMVCQLKSSPTPLSFCITGRRLVSQNTDRAQSQTHLSCR